MPDRKRGRSFGKLKSRLGYTLTEAIVSVLIIALLAVAISSGLTVAMKVYKQSLFTSNSEILEDTINAALSDVLRFADVNDSDAAGSGSAGSTDGSGGDAVSADTVHFYNKQYTDSDEGYIAVSNGYICIFKDASDLDGALLVNTGAYDDIRASHFQMTYDSGTKTFTGSYELKNDDGSLVKDCGFTYRTVVM